MQNLWPSHDTKVTMFESKLNKNHEAQSLNNIMLKEENENRNLITKNYEKNMSKPGLIC